MTLPIKQSSYLIVICGPTASGKTGLSLDIARHFRAPILSADSRQVYREMKIGTATPTAEELKAAPHHFIGNKSIKEEYTAAEYANDALQLLDEIFQNKHIAILCGGSGLYINALLHCLDEIPSVPETVRRQLQEKGLQELQKQLQTLDLISFNQIDINNPQRVIRALEVTVGTGQPYSSFLRRSAEQRSFKPIRIAINWPREELYNRINQRCEAMLAAGLLKEVKRLVPYRDHQALQTVGYKEFFDFLDGNCTYEEAVGKFKQHTRNYAKRQLTWFRKDQGIRWFKPEDVGKVPLLLNEQMR